MVLNSQPTADVVIPVASSNAAEGTASVSSLTFTAADWNAPQTVTVTGVDDHLQDGAIAYDVLRHRVLLTYEAEAEEITSEQLLKRIFDHLPVP